MTAKRKSDFSFLTAILYIVIGVMFIVFKAQMLDWLMTAAGIVLIVLGKITVKEKPVDPNADEY